MHSYFFSTWKAYISYMWPPERILRPCLGIQVTKENVHIIIWIYWHKYCIWWEFANGLFKLFLTLGQFCQSSGLLRWIFIFIKIGIWRIHNMSYKMFIPSMPILSSKTSSSFFGRNFTETMCCCCNFSPQVS